MATIEEITKGFPKKYVCVKDTVLDENNLIVTAEIIRVFDTLEIAKDNASEIRKLMKKYKDFDIVYGDYEDYVNTRRGRKIQNRVTLVDNGKEKLSQENIDELIRVMTMKEGICYTEE